MKTIEELAKELYPDVSFKKDVESEDTFRTNEIRRIQRVAFWKGYEEAKKWRKAEDELPELDPDTGCSKNVLARVEGHDEIMVMCYCVIPDNDGGYFCAWANCYGDIHGDGEYDDDYNVIEWKYID